MKIKEAIVIDNKVIDELIAECENKIDNIFITNSLALFTEGQLSILKHIKSQLNPLEPIVRDAYLDGMCTDGDWEYCSKKYINQTEI